MRYTFTLLFYFLLSCQQNNGKATKISKNNEEIHSLSNNEPTAVELDSNVAKSWLVEAIRKHFQDTSTTMQQITTPEYYEFKMDAMNVDLDIEGSLTAEEFKKKWLKKYDPNTHPMHIGFLIPGQDWGKIIVHEIALKKINKDKGSLAFSIIIRDEELKVDYDRDIIVIENDGQFLIADVLEYD